METTNSGEISRDVWVVGYQFPTDLNALEAWVAVRDAMLSADLDISAFRFSLEDDKFFVALAGEKPLTVNGQSVLKPLLSKGQEVELTGNATEFLKSRRRAFKQTGFDFIERTHAGR